MAHKAAASAVACQLHVVRCMVSAAWCLLRAFGRLTSPASFLLHVVRCTLSSLVCLRCVLFAARCLLRGFCHTLSAARCLLRVDAARCALRVVCCMVSAARFRPPHVPRIVSAACCPPRVVLSCLPSVCVVRWMVRAGCCPLHECLLHVGCGSLQPASNVRLPLHRLPLSTVPRYALRSGTEWGMLHRTTAWGNASLRCASHAVRNRTTPRSTVAVLSVAIVVWQPPTAGGVVALRTFHRARSSQQRCRTFHADARVCIFLAGGTLESPSPSFREGSRHPTAC